MTKVLKFNLFSPPPPPPTTTGYGNTTPTTELGKIVTIFYAIIGMPLFLLYLSNIGNLLLYDASDDHSTFNTHNRQFDRTRSELIQFTDDDKKKVYMRENIEN